MHSAPNTPNSLSGFSFIVFCPCLLCLSPVLLLNLSCSLTNLLQLHQWQKQPDLCCSFPKNRAFSGSCNLLIGSGFTFSFKVELRLKYYAKNYKFRGRDQQKGTLGGAGAASREDGDAQCEALGRDTALITRQRRSHPKSHSEGSALVL